VAQALSSNRKGEIHRKLLQPTNLNEIRFALWGRGFCPAAGLPPGVAWNADAPGETKRTRI
jgi:hypothetical protein